MKSRRSDRKNTSKFISLILRHKPEIIDISVIYEIDCRRMIEDGYHFYESANHVWLTKEVPTRYLKKED